MNWLQKQRENERLIHLYMRYLHNTSVHKRQALRLMSEIGRLNSQNEWIKEMTVDDYYQKCKTTTVRIQSSL